MPPKGPLVAAIVFGAIALGLAVVLWPAVAASAKLAFFGLGFAAGAAAMRVVTS